MSIPNKNFQNQNKKQERTTRKNRQKAHGPTNTATPSLRSSASAPLKKRPPDRKKSVIRRPQNSTAKNTPNAQSPLFQRLRAAPARAKPPVNFALDRQGRKSVKTREPTASNAKKRQALSKRTKKMSNQRQRKTYYAKQAAKPCKTQQAMRKKDKQTLKAYKKNVKTRKNQ